MALGVRQLREESNERLREMLAETRAKLFKHRLRIASGEGVNPHEARDMRREIARLNTLLRAVELVASRAGVDEARARASLEERGWDVHRAVEAIKAGPAEKA